MRMLTDAMRMLTQAIEENAATVLLGDSLCDVCYAYADGCYAYADTGD